MRLPIGPATPWEYTVPTPPSPERRLMSRTPGRHSGHFSPSRTYAKTASGGRLIETVCCALGIGLSCGAWWRPPESTHHAPSAHSGARTYNARCDHRNALGNDPGRQDDDWRPAG